MLNAVQLRNFLQVSQKFRKAFYRSTRQRAAKSVTQQANDPKKTMKTCFPSAIVGASRRTTFFVLAENEKL